MKQYNLIEKEIDMLYITGEDYYNNKQYRKAKSYFIQVRNIARNFPQLINVEKRCNYFINMCNSLENILEVKDEK